MGIPAYGSDLQPSAFGPAIQLGRASSATPPHALRSEGGASLRASASAVDVVVDGLDAFSLVGGIDGRGDGGVGRGSAGCNCRQVAVGISSHLRHCHEGKPSMARHRFILLEYTCHALALPCASLVRFSPSTLEFRFRFRSIILAQNQPARAHQKRGGRS